MAQRVLKLTNVNLGYLGYLEIINIMVLLSESLVAM